MDEMCFGTHVNVQNCSPPRQLLVDAFVFLAASAMISSSFLALNVKRLDFVSLG